MWDDALTHNFILYPRGVEWDLSPDFSVVFSARRHFSGRKKTRRLPAGPVTGAVILLVTPLLQGNLKNLKLINQITVYLLICN